MSIRIFKEPEMKNPALVAAWSGIGNIGTITADYLRQETEAELLAEIEPYEFFYPKKMEIKSGILEEMVFPSCKFYFQRLGKGDLIIFLGEEQPYSRARGHAEGRRAYEMANLVLDVASKFRCRRVYTSGAAVAFIHHSAKPKVWAVPNKMALVEEIRQYRNTVLLSDIGRAEGQGAISGLNGLLIGVAKEKGLEGICLLGEIPVYLQGLALPYPKASESVLEVLSGTLGIQMDLGRLRKWARELEERIDEILEEIDKTASIQIGIGIKESIEKLKSRPERPGHLTEEDARKAIEEIEKFFRKKGGTGDGERPL